MKKRNNIWTICYVPDALLDFPSGSDGKESAYNVGDLGSIPWVRKIPWRRKWQPTPVLLLGKIPWIEKPDRLQSTGSQRVGHDWVTSLHFKYFIDVIHNLTFTETLWDRYYYTVCKGRDWGAERLRPLILEVAEPDCEAGLSDSQAHKNQK